MESSAYAWPSVGIDFAGQSSPWRTLGSPVRAKSEGAAQARLVDSAEAQMGFWQKPDVAAESGAQALRASAFEARLNDFQTARLGLLSKPPYTVQTDFDVAAPARF